VPLESLPTAVELPERSSAVSGIPFSDTISSAGRPSRNAGTFWYNDKSAAGCLGRPSSSVRPSTYLIGGRPGIKSESHPQ